MKTDNRILGVIGGMGPLASQLFYKMVIENTQADKDQEHLDMIILNHASMPDRTAAIAAGKTNELLSLLVEDAKLLELAGADFGLIPCNTSHVLMEELQRQTSLTMIHMVQTTADYLGETCKRGDKVGIMATDGTIQTALYQKALEAVDLVSVLPQPDNQKLVMQLIYDGVKGGNPIDHGAFQQVEQQFRADGCSRVILACTELSCLKEWKGLPDYFVDAMEITARRAIQLCGKQLKEKRKETAIK